MMRLLKTLALLLACVALLGVAGVYGALVLLHVPARTRLRQLP